MLKVLARRKPPSIVDLIELKIKPKEAKKPSLEQWLPISIVLAFRVLRLIVVLDAGL